MIKTILQHKCFLVKICKNFKNTYFEEHLRTAASAGSYEVYILCYIRGTAVQIIKIFS